MSPMAATRRAMRTNPRSRDTAVPDAMIAVFWDDLRQSGDTKGAVAELRALLVRHPEFSDAHGLLAAIERESEP